MEAKINRNQIIGLCVKFSKSDNVKHEQTNTAHLSYSKDEHLILLKRGIEVCRISLITPRTIEEPYIIRFGSCDIKITPKDKDWKKVIGCFKQNPNNFPTYKQVLKLL